MRQVVLDTETTGLEVERGHRILEIGAVEIIDRKATGNHFHEYINLIDLKALVSFNNIINLSNYSFFISF